MQNSAAMAVVVMANCEIVERKPDEAEYPRSNQDFGHIEMYHSVTPPASKYTPLSNGCKVAIEG